MLTRTRLAVFCAMGALMWAGTFALLSHFGILSIDWEAVARWTVLVVLAVFTVGAIWLKVEEEDAQLEYEEEMRREAEALDYDEYEEAQPPREVA